MLIYVVTEVVFGLWAARLDGVVVDLGSGV